MAWPGVGLDLRQLGREGVLGMFVLKMLRVRLGVGHLGLEETERSSINKSKHGVIDVGQS